MFNNLAKKDKKKRDLFKKYEIKKKILKVLLITTKKVKYQKLLSNLPRDCSISRLKNRCLLTGTSKSVYKKFKLSRWSLKQQLILGRVPGYKKSSW